MKSIFKKISLLAVPMALFSLSLTSCQKSDAQAQPIDREALVGRHAVKVSQVDSLSSVSVGNGDFAMTVDATGLQSFPERYALGVPLGTMSQWGWHSFPNTQKYTTEETLKNYDFRGKQEPYAVQFNEMGRQRSAANYYRENPHRMHLGYVGLAMTDANAKALTAKDLQNIDQTLDMWNGRIDSRFVAAGEAVEVSTFCHPEKDMIAARVASPLIAKKQLKISWKFPYPSGKHSDDATHWNSPEKHTTRIVSQDANAVVLERVLDATTYYVKISWEGKASFQKAKQAHTFYLVSAEPEINFTTEFVEAAPSLAEKAEVKAVESLASNHWQSFWKNGGAIDFSLCKDERAFELERRVVLSQYLTAIQCAGMYPPQETGLTYNSWFGKYHLEMHWWHGVHFALWNRDELLIPSLNWYFQAEDMAREIAQRQGFKGVRWMKMTDPSATEAPSKVGSFLIWQQPHILYMAELVYRNHPTDTALWKPYAELVFETAEFMADFADYDGMGDRYVLKGAIPAQETLRAAETINPPFELSYWHYALNVAQAWRQRLGMPKNMEWEIVLDKLSPLAYNEDKLYLAAETATDTYIDIRYTSDHMAVLGALGVMPESRLLRKDIMTNTFNWIWDNWNWGKTWGWDYPMTAMCAARLGLPEKAVGALLMDRRTNTYLINGHNYQDGRLRLYMPGNGGLLTAVSMMCAGWDGNEGRPGINNGKRKGGYAPGFPQDGNWAVQWENLSVMP